LCHDGPMKNLKILSLFVLFAAAGLITQILKAQPAPLGLPAQSVPFKEFSQQGNLFSIKIIPAGKETHLYLVGNDAASVKFEKLSVVGRIKIGENEKVIQFHKDKDYFTTDEIVHGHTLHLKAKDEETQNSEEFHVDLKKP